MTDPSSAVNAWIFLNEDEPSGTNYSSSNSCYQTAIRYGVYGAVDMLGICFFSLTGPVSSKTLMMAPVSHPGGLTNVDYLRHIVVDARAVNPKIKLLATLVWGDDEFGPLFPPTAPDTWSANTAAFAANLTAYLIANDLDGFDVDWEAPLSRGINSQQFAMLFQAIGSAFKSSSSRRLYLVLSPAEPDNLDAATVNQYFDIVNLQLYSGFTSASQFLEIGVSKSLLAYGAKFETAAEGMPYQDAWSAQSGARDGGYPVITQWRLNSDDYQFEQAQQLILAQLVRGASEVFDDTNIVAAAGEPPIVALTTRSGDVLDAVQATNKGSLNGVPLVYLLPLHGGNGGDARTFAVDPADPIVSVSGFTGDWYGWNVAFKVSFQTRSGAVLGPFGSGSHTTNAKPFTLSGASGQALVALKGTTVTVPTAQGGQTIVVRTLGATFA